MSYEKALQIAIKKLLIFQLFSVLAVAVGTLVFSGLAMCVAVMYGGGVAIINTLLQQWHARRAERVAGNSPERNMRLLFRCAIERFVAAVVLLAIGLGILGLMPLALILGFVTAQLAQIYRLITESGLRRKHV